MPIHEFSMVRVALMLTISAHHTYPQILMWAIHDWGKTPWATRNITGLILHFEKAGQRIRKAVQNSQSPFKELGTGSFLVRWNYSQLRENDGHNTYVCTLDMPYQWATSIPFWNQLTTQPLEKVLSGSLTDFYFFSYFGIKGIFSPVPSSGSTLAQNKTGLLLFH